MQCKLTHTHTHARAHTRTHAYTYTHSRTHTCSHAHMKISVLLYRGKREYYNKVSFLDIYVITKVGRKHTGLSEAVITELSLQQFINLL